MGNFSGGSPCFEYTASALEGSSQELSLLVVFLALETDSLSCPRLAEFSLEFTNSKQHGSQGEIRASLVLSKAAARLIVETIPEIH